MSEAIRMEIKIAGKFLDCSTYWLVALVADNSHVVYLGGGRTPQNWASLQTWVITSYATTDASDDVENPEEKC
jgi:hypothetical protein